MRKVKKGVTSHCSFLKIDRAEMRDLLAMSLDSSHHSSKAVSFLGVYLASVRFKSSVFVNIVVENKIITSRELQFSIFFHTSDMKEPFSRFEFLLRLFEIMIQN